jgi:hypothetical protein
MGPEPRCYLRGVLKVYIFPENYYIRLGTFAVHQ